MRVLHLSAGNLYGGIETLLATLARHRSLCPAMQPHFALCFQGRLKDELADAGAPVDLLGHVRVSRPWTAWQARRRLHGLLGREHFDAAITHGCWPHALFAPVVQSRGLPLIFWAHAVHRGQHWLERWARHSKPDLVLANSWFTQSAMANLFPNVRCEVLYLPVPGPGATDRARARRETRAALQTPEDTTVIVQASRLERWKGHALLLDALGQLRQVSKLGDWVCWIAGGSQRPHEAAYLEELKATAAGKGVANRVRFLGERSDVRQLLAAADIYCQPNTGPEPFGIALVEALYAGLPVVTTALGGAVEIVDDTCGILVSPEDSSALAAVLGRLIQDVCWRRMLGGAGEARARHLCDPRNQMGRLEDALRAIIDRRTDFNPFSQHQRIEIRSTPITIAPDLLREQEASP